MSTLPRKLVPVVSRQEALDLQLRNELEQAAHADFNEVVDEDSDDDFVDAAEDVAGYDRRAALEQAGEDQGRAQKMGTQVFPTATAPDTMDVQMQEAGDTQLGAPMYGMSNEQYWTSSTAYDQDASELFPELGQIQQPMDFEELGLYNYQPQVTAQPASVPPTAHQYYAQAGIADGGEIALAHEQARAGADAVEDLVSTSFATNKQPELPSSPENDTETSSDVEIVDQNEQATNSAALVAEGYRIDPSRPETPPLPAPSTPSKPSHVLEGETYSVTKTSASSIAARNAELNRVTAATGPVAPRDVAPELTRYEKLHHTALALVSRLPNYQTFPWTRRYWIAVCLHTTPSGKPLKKLSEKDFMWMKGHKDSTVSTVWHSYQMRTLCGEDLVLVCRGEICDLEMRAEELDWFGQRLVVFRAMEGEAAEKQREMGGKLGSGIGIVPREEQVVVEVE